jgi:Cu(I)/Ag(I) efflux system membrane fusion protein
VVYIDQGGGAYEHTTLKTGRRGDTHVEVLSGLREGDAVVTNGNLLIDGQAEMNRAFVSPPETVKPATTPRALNGEQTQAITEFIQVADAMSAALGADDLTDFKVASESAMKTTGAMVKLLRPEVAESKTLDALDGARHFHGIGDLPGARAAFHKFSVAATAVLEPLRKAGGTPDFQIYECGMVDQAIPGVPKKARWIQTGGREMRNPFFGKEMPDCGEEIKR